MRSTCSSSWYGRTSALAREHVRRAIVEGERASETSLVGGCRVGRARCECLGLRRLHGPAEQLHFPPAVRAQGRAREELEREPAPFDQLQQSAGRADHLSRSRWHVRAGWVRVGWGSRRELWRARTRGHPAIIDVLFAGCRHGLRGEQTGALLSEVAGRSPPRRAALRRMAQARPLSTAQAPSCANRPAATSAIAALASTSFRPRSLTFFSSSGLAMISSRSSPSRMPFAAMKGHVP